jgi:hypothetical protein
VRFEIESGNMSTGSCPPNLTMVKICMMGVTQPVMGKPPGEDSKHGDISGTNLRATLSLGNLHKY